MVIVAFKNSRDKLVNFFAASYESVNLAKADIEADAKAFAAYHKGRVRWVKPKTEDYCEVKGKDGESCVWQYMSYGRR